MDINKYTNITSFKKFDSQFYAYNNELITFLKSIDKNTMSNIILYGHSGSGKKSIIYSFLETGEKTKIIQNIKTQNKNIELLYYSTENIVEIDISLFGIYKIQIFKQFIKNIITMKDIIHRKKIIIIHNIDSLCYDDQYILRKIIEDYAKNATFIMITKTINNIMKPIISRSIVLRTKILTNEIII